MTTPTTTRRAFIGSGVAAALVLAGCGGGSGSSAGAGSTASTGGGSDTRVVKTVKGPVTVPTEPTRVVTVHPSVVDPLYDFGVDPVGVYDIGDAANIPPRYRSRWQQAEKIGDDGEFDMAKIAALEPELIIGADYEWNTEDYARLGKIAPTVIAPSTEWRESAHTIADAVGRFERLAELQKELEQRSAKIRAELTKQLDAYRWDLLQGGGEGGEYLLYGAKSGVGGILTAAGVRLAPGSAGVTGGEDEALSIFGVTAGLEGVTNKAEIGALDGAGVIGYYADYDGSPKNEGLLFEQAEFKEIEAAKAGRLVPLAEFLPQGYGDALALLDELEVGLKSIA
ncbi:MAG: ABC transporter substrate-binding protein [Solirubrobacterales bacterium]